MKKYYFSLVALFVMNGATAQWTQLNPLPQTNSLSSIFFTDANTGYLVGDSGIILKTINAGTTWTALSSGTNVNLYSVQFTDANTGYASGETMLKTTDGGTIWSNILEVGTSICFPDADTGYAIGPGWSTIKTIDGGTTWTNLGLIGNGGETSVYFTDANTGFITHYYAMHGGILKTIDGGMTWTSTYNAGSISMTPLFSIYFTDVNIGYAVGGDWNGYSSTICKTTNGGTDWTMQELTGTHTLRSVYFTDANTGFAVGDSGTILRTSNGGTDWIIQSSGTSQNLTSVYFTDPDIGYAVGDSGIILKTTNGGFPLGINDKNQSANSFTIYPNPSSNNINIETPASGHLSILNLNGQELITHQITEPRTTLDISSLPNGVYIVRVINNKKVVVGKIIKQ